MAMTLGALSDKKLTSFWLDFCVDFNCLWLSRQDFERHICLGICVEVGENERRIIIRDQQTEVPSERIMNAFYHFSIEYSNRGPM